MSCDRRWRQVTACKQDRSCAPGLEAVATGRLRHVVEHLLQRVFVSFCLSAFLWLVSRQSSCFSHKVAASDGARVGSAVATKLPANRHH
jgi:hypothetical protein